MEQTLLHASCVALRGRAVLIQGESGSGKSGLALELMAYGAELVSDDQTVLLELDGALWATAPASIKGLIEARGVGILTAKSCGSAEVVLAVDMDAEEQRRLPHPNEKTIAGVRVPVFHKVDTRYFPAAILQYLRVGRRGPQ
nr:HPr kinase/phosphatase C-terminal domain-containing protein [uncultured Roseobacter sp.]